MSDLPRRARAVIIGAGIAGNGVAFHLAQLGWDDLVMLDKGPLPNPGGSTGHSSASIWLPEVSLLLSRVVEDSVRRYQELGVYLHCGGIQVARTDERVEEFKRKLALARTWGYEARILTPTEVAGLVPFLDPHAIKAGLHMPETGVVDAVRAGTLMRDEALANGALLVSADTEVLDVFVEDGTVTGIRTNRGDIATDTVVVCCGVWSPRLARMAGASIPITPGVSQAVSVGPIPRFADTVGEISFPIIRDIDNKIYGRQHGSDMEMGATPRRTILVDPDEIPSNAEAHLSPTEFPFTQDDFDEPAERSLELMPAIFDDEHAGIRYAINGLVSLGPDGAPTIGESPTVSGFWSANRIDVKLGPTIARTLARWMVEGKREVYGHPFDVERFRDHELTATFVRDRGVEWWYRRNHSVLHPALEWVAGRGIRLTPMHEREQALGAVFTEAAGWELPKWYGTNEPLLASYGDRVLPRDAEWDARWWSPIVNAEHLAMRDGVGLADASSLAAYDVRGPGAVAFLQRVVFHDVDVSLGRSVETWLLDPAGHAVSDPVLFRLGPDHYRFVTAELRELSDRAWLTNHLTPDDAVHLCDASSAWCAVRVAGPRATELLQAVTEADLSAAGFALGTVQAVDVGSMRTLAWHRDWLGEPAWELHAPSEHGRRLWDTLWEAGQAFGVIPVGEGAATSGRVEKGRPSPGAELVDDYDLAEAAPDGLPVKPADFIGKAAYLAQLDQPPAAVLCTLSVDDPCAATGERRAMLGGEPILARDGTWLTDARGRHPYVTTAAAGPSVGRHLLMAYVPTELSTVGTELAVEYFGERYPVTVAARGLTAIFDPEGTRLRE